MRAPRAPSLQAGVWCRSSLVFSLDLLRASVAMAHACGAAPRGSVFKDRELVLAAPRKGSGGASPAGGSPRSVYPRSGIPSSLRGLILLALVATAAAQAAVDCESFNAGASDSFWCVGPRERFTV